MSGKSVDLAIVGAGAAGLAAGLAARAGGLSVALLEAGGRIGGRAHTDLTSLRTGPFDLGCHWMHDASENPFAALALANGTPHRNSPHPGRMPHWLSRAGQEASADVRDAVAGYYRESFDAFDAAGAEGRDVDGLSVIDATSPHYPLFRGWCAALYGVPPERISTGDIAAMWETPENWPVETGYGHLITGVFGDQPVTLNCPVHHIDRTGTRVLLETAQGSIEADQVIVAVSSTVLIEEAIRFTPALPADVSSAIEAVPLGHAERVGVSLSEKIDGLGDHRAGHMLTGDGEEIGLMIHEFGRAELTGYLAGDLARAAGAEGPDAVHAVFREALKEAFGSGIETRITAWTASGWSGDPLIRGAYSHAVPGEAHRRARLAEPVDERLILAGEATHPRRFASAHGAAMSGMRAAAQALARRKARA